MILLRSALFNAWFFGLTFVLGSWGLVIRALAPHRALEVAQLWARLALAGARVLAGIQVVVTGREHLPTEGPALIASQHQSAFDTLVWLVLVPRASYVVKKELTRLPLFGGLLRPAGQIPVDRGAGAAALRDLLRGAEAAAAAGRQIVIFPEGTRLEHGQSASLQPGIAALAARLRLPVTPVATDSGLRWGRRAFRKTPGPVHIAILPPLPWDQSRQALVETLQAAWREARPGLSGPVDNSVGG